MRILFIAPHPFMAERGTPMAVLDALRVLSSLGHTVDVATYHAGEAVEVEGVTLHRIDRPALVKRVPIGPSWQKALCDVKLYALVKRLMRGARYDAVHAVEEAAFMAARLGAKRGEGFGVPFVYDMDSQMSRQVREKSWVLGPAAWVFDRLERRAVKRSAGVLAVCPALVEVAEAMGGAGKVMLLPDVPQGCDEKLDDGEALPKEVTAEGGVKFVYVGNLEHYQGVGLMIDAFAAAALGDAATLVVVGGDDAGIARYRKRAEALGVADRVRFAGRVPVRRLGRVLEEADVLVSPRTKGQNTPMKVYSYLQAGKAVLATRLPTHTQVLDEAVAGAEVAALADAEAGGMAAAMLGLVADPARRGALGEAGLAYVEREFSAARFEERLSGFYARTFDGAGRIGAEAPTPVNGAAA